MSSYQIVVLAHVVAGSIALLSYWAAAVARKGGQLHRRIGQSFLLAMLGVIATAGVIAAVAFARGQLFNGIFLSFLLIITATGCWAAWRAPRSKRDPGAFYNRGFAAIGLVNLVAGLVVFACGLKLGNAVLMSFCWIGVFVGLGMLRRWRLTERPVNWWLREHYQAMLGNGVATHVAFLSIGFNRLAQAAGLSVPEVLPWLLPLSVALAAGIWLDRRYPAKWRQGRAPAATRPAGEAVQAT